VEERDGRDERRQGRGGGGGGGGGVGGGGCWGGGWVVWWSGGWSLGWGGGVGGGVVGGVVLHRAQPEGSTNEKENERSKREISERGEFVNGSSESRKREKPGKKRGQYDHI